MFRAGYFRLTVQPYGQKSWGELECAPFDESARMKADRREAVKERIGATQRGWALDYYQFFNATFRITEHSNNFRDDPVVVLGPPLAKPKKKIARYKRGSGSSQLALPIKHSAADVIRQEPKAKVVDQKIRKYRSVNRYRRQSKGFVK